MNPKLKPILFRSLDRYRESIETYDAIANLDAYAKIAPMGIKLSGMTVTNLVDGEDIADSGTVTFASISGDKYYESLTPSVVTGTGSDITLTNSSGVTKDIHVIHLNAIGLEAISDVPTLTAMFPHYIDGTVSAGATRWTSLGKNLFDKDRATLGYAVVPSTGSLLVSADFTVTDYIKIEPNRDIYLTKLRAAAFYDVNKVYVSGNTGTGDRSLTTPAEARYMRAHMYNYDVSLAQLEYGSTATTYEPYVESVSYTPPNTVLRRLPNGTRDTIEQKSDGTWKRVQRVSDGVAVIGVVAVNTINYPLSQTGGSFINVLTAGGTETGIIGTNSTSADGTLYYQLATPMETYYTATPTLYSQPNGTVIAEPWDVDLIDTSTVAIPLKTYEYK